MRFPASIRVPPLPALAAGLVPAPVWACASCRPTVVQAVYDGQFLSRLFLVLMPVIILLLGLAAVAAWLDRPQRGDRQ